MVTASNYCIICDLTNTTGMSHLKVVLFILVNNMEYYDWNIDSKHCGWAG